MALWMLLSALFPIFFFGTLIKAILHFRRIRALARYRRYGTGLTGVTALTSPTGLTGPTNHPGLPIREDRVETQDWVPSR